jgi:glycoside/pentoside/hexuronide:cation symporter, GPH family
MAALLYASNSFATNLISRVTSAWLFYFYAGDAEAGDPRRLPVWAIGAILTATNIIGAFDDPLIGYWSDRTTSRWGRRIPFVLLGTPPWVLIFFLLWTPPHSTESALNALYCFLLLAGFRVVTTVSGGPMEALLPEIAPTNADRLRIVAGQVVFGSGGVVVALLLAGPIIDRLGFPAMAALVALAALASRYVALAGVWRYARKDVAPAGLALMAALRATLGNRQFLCFLPSFILFNLGITLLTAALPFFVREVLEPADGRVGTTTALVTAAPGVMVFLSLPFVYRAALHRGKAWMYRRMMLAGAVYLPLLFFMGFVPGVPRVVQAMVFLAPVGVCMGGVFLFPNALLADIADYDAVRTGMRREAIYYGAQNMIEGTVVALYSVLLAGLLAIGGTADDPLGIRLAGPVAGVCILAGALIFRGYRLPDTITPESVAHL